MTKEQHTSYDDEILIICKSKFSCHRKWKDLRTIENEPQVRYCTDCMKPVFLCTSHEEFLKHADESHCINLYANQDDEFTGFVII